MGYSISWVAAQAAGETALAAFGLRPTGERLEEPGAPIVGGAIGDGWYLVVAQGCDHALISQRTLARVSTNLAVVACSIEEHVMFSRVSFWERGVEVWAVTHDAQRGIEHLDVTGAPPAFVAEIRQRCLTQQRAEGGADVDYVFDVPVEAGAKIGGYRHDAVGGPEIYDALEAVVGSVLGRSKAWWKVW